MTAPTPHTVIILGAGLTGLTAAYHLSRHDYRVTVLDHHDWRDEFRSNPSDPVPILLGCHHETRRIFHTLGQFGPTHADTMIPLEFRLPDGRAVSYQSTRLPGAFQWMMSLFSFDGLAWHDRWRLFSHVEQIWEQAHTLPADLENRIADEWLTSIGQSLKARQQIWAPLTQWLTGTPVEHLSAATFVHLLSTVFLGDASDARLTHLDGLVANRLTAPMTQVLPQNRVEVVHLPHEPTLHFGQTGISHIRRHDGTRLEAQWYLVALPYQRLLTLLPERLLTRYAYFAQLTDLKNQPEIVVHMTCRATTRVPRLLLLTERPFHHLTVTPVGPEQVRYSLCTTGNSPLMELNDDQLFVLARAELSMLYPAVEMDTISAEEVSRESQATLLLIPGAARLRPLQQSPIQNMLVAGAWTDTGWPSNLESTLVSARRCAEIILGRSA